MTKRIAVVGLPGGWSSERLADALAERTGFRHLVDLERVYFDVEAGRVVDGELDLTTLDGLIIKKIGADYSPDMLDRLELIRYVHTQGVPVFSSPLSVLRLLDRLSCTVSMRAAGIPIPPTVVTENVPHAVRVVRAYGAAVLKPLYSTKARGMTLIDTVEVSEPGAIETALRQFQASGNPMMYIQKRVELLERDYGMVFMGGEYLGTYARVKGAGQWNTTIHAGGKYAPYEPSAELVELGRRAQAPFELTFASVDIAVTESGPVVFEVSAFGGYRGLFEGCGVDAAAQYAEYVIDRIQRT